MSIVCKVRVAGLVLAASLMSAMEAGAVTVKEADAPGGAFSASYTSATQIGAGVETITGTGSQNAFDNFVFTGLPSGAQKLTLTFTAPEGIGYSYSAGGAVLHDSQAFDYGWDGTYGANVQVDYYSRSRSYEIALGDTFSGRLYLALNFTHGSGLAYTIGVPTNATPVTASPVPLPAGAVLIGSAAAALLGLGIARRRRVGAV